MSCVGMRIPSPLFSAIGQLRGFDMLLEELQLDDWEKTNTGRNTEYRLVVCPWCTPRIISVGSTADYAYISMHMFQHDISYHRLNPPAVPNRSSLSFLNILYLWLKLLLIFHAYRLLNIPWASLLQFYGLFAWGNKTYQTYQVFQNQVR